MSVFSFPFNDRIRRQPCYAEKSSVGRDAAAEAEETIPQERLPWECEDRGRMTLSVPHRIECKPCRHNQGVGIIRGPALAYLPPGPRKRMASATWSRWPRSSTVRHGRFTETRAAAIDAQRSTCHRLSKSETESCFLSSHSRNGSLKKNS